MSFFSRIFGISRTRQPADPGCWSYSDNRLTIDLSRAPELGTKGGAIRLEGSNLPCRVLVFRGEDGLCRAMRNQCTHAGRRLDPLPGQPQIQCCSVGKTTFTYDGQRLSGSGKKDTAVFPVAEENGRLMILLQSD